MNSPINFRRTPNVTFSPKPSAIVLPFLLSYVLVSLSVAEINKEIEGVTKTSDALKILANADTMKVLGVQRPLLQVITFFELILSAVFTDLARVTN